MMTLPRSAADVLADHVGALAIGAGFAVVLGDGDGDPPAAAPESAPAAEPSENATILVPPKEAAFVDAVRKAVPADELEEEDDLSILNSGRELCDLSPRLETGEVDEDTLPTMGEPSLDSLIEDPPDRAGRLANISARSTCRC